MLLAAPTRAAFALHWWPHQVKGRRCYRFRAVSTAPGERVHTRDSLPGGWALGRALADYLAAWHTLSGGSLQVAAEDVYIGENPRTAVELAKFAGAIASHVEHLDPRGECKWIKPAEWRHVILGLNIRTKRDAAKEVSVRLMPRRVEGLDQLLDVLGRDNDHVCDAAGVAVWRTTVPG